MTEEKVEKSILQASAYLSPYRIVLTLVVIVFISESIIMVLISSLAPMPALYEAFIDSFMLVALISPALYFFLLKPILSDIRERKLMEERVRKNEARNSSILESIPEMLFILNKDGVFIGFKPTKGLETLMPPEEFIGKKVSEVLPANLADQTLKHIELALSTETTQLFEYELPSKGIMHNYEAKISRISVDEALCIVRDITERKQAEKALHDSEAKFRTIFEGAAIGMALFEFNGQPIMSNPALQRILGYDPEKLTFELISELTYPEDLKADLKLFNEIIEGKRDSYQIEKRYLRKDGIIVFGQLTVSLLRGNDNEPRFIVSMLEDITERRKIEAARRDSEARLMEAQRIARIGNWELNIETDTLIWSDEIFRIFEIDKERFGASYDAFLNAIHPEDRDAVNTAYTQSVGTRNPYKITHRLLMNDGRIKYVHEQCETYYNSEGKPLRSVGTIQDITDRKQAERNQDLSAKILGILNESDALTEAIKRILTVIQLETGFDAVGIRLQKGDDFPYFVHNGFSSDFLLTENTLTVPDHNGGICRDKNGKASLECTCGLVLSGQADLTNPLFTPGGSAWTNNSLPLLDLPAAHDPRLHPRNRCIHEGFCSVALIPVRVNQEIVGLLQLNDRRKDRFTLEMIEFFEGISASIGVALMHKQAEEKIKKSLEEKEVLLREIHHRVKNNMQIISSLLMLQSQNIEDEKYKDIFIESQTRIHSMALIHEKLYQSESFAQINFKEYINGIVSNIFESYCIKSNIKIDINVENIPIKIDYAVPCGLIINELVTNSLKYAFPDGRQGKIQISLKSNDNNMIQLSISDDGIGIAKDMDIRNTRSLGLHLVTALAEGQLHGKIILNRERGTEFQISFGAK